MKLSKTKYIQSVTWRIFTTLLRVSKRGFLQWYPLYWQPEEESFTSAFGVFRILVLFTYSFCYLSFMREKIMRRAKSATTYCFRASCFSVGPQHPWSYLRPPRHRHDAASNISWRSFPPAVTSCQSYVLFLFAFAS